MALEANACAALFADLRCKVIVNTRHRFEDLRAAHQKACYSRASL